jgi:signal transduction histidine kinase/CheY-like chemotaxis protein
MSDSSWHSLNVVVLSGTVQELREAPLPEQDAVIVVDCPEPHAGLLVVRPRTRALLIVLADGDARTTAGMVADGAADVVPRSASSVELIRAARHAAARGGDGGHGAPRDAARRATDAPVPPLRQATADQTPHPRDGGPPDMPPQLQAVGRLAGGVAHDFNNLLQVIGGSAESLVHELPPGDPRRSEAQAIVDAARRAAMLTHQLLAFGRRQTLIATSIDLSALVTEASVHLRERLGARIQLVTRLAQGLPAVHADRSQILEVLAKLTDNAVEAMPDGGTLSISTAAIEVDDSMRAGRPWLRPGRYVQLQMADSGGGIDERVLPHLFEPFYSTKSGWGGTGLGLSSVYGIIKQSGGFIWIDSRLGQGTRVTILLPPVSPAPVESAVPVSPARGKVLLVEDDEGVRDLLVGILTHYGYGVDAYASAEEALLHVGPFELLLSDVLLPGMNGPDLAREMRRRHPGLAVLLMSGDTGHVVDPRELDAGGFLQKPFNARTLIERVEELLGRAQARGNASDR